MIKKNRKSVIYLTYDGLTDPLGQSQIIPYLSGLSKEGHKISIISFEKKENEEQETDIRNMLNQASIDWHLLSYTRKPPILSTVWDIYRLKKLTLRLHNQKKFDLIHCRSYITSLVGLFMKRKHGLPFIFDMRGFWADERVDGSLWDLKNPIFSRVYRFFKNKERAFLSESDHIVSLTNAGKRIIEKELVPQKPTPVTVIPCCVDLAHFNPNQLPKSISKEQLGISENSFVLGYVGSIGTWYMLPEMLDFFKVLLEEKPNAIFLFVTKESPAYIHAELSKKEISQDRVRIKSANRDEVPGYISLFDWSTFFIKPAFSKQASSPTKQGEIMAIGVPIICNQHIGDTDEIIKKYQSGVSVSSFEKESFDQAVKEMMTFDYKPEALRAGCIDYFSLDLGVRLYSDIYASLTS